VFSVIIKLFLFLFSVIYQVMLFAVTFINFI